MDRTDTEVAILDATAAALVEHGYAELSMAKIAAEFEKSQSLIHHYFDDKEGLLAAFLAFQRERVRDRLSEFPDAPGPRFEAIVDRRVRGFDEWARDEMTAAYMELTAAAARSEPIRRELTALDDLLREEIAATVAAGIEDGTFVDVDPDEVAAMVMAAHDRTAMQSMYDADGKRVADALDRFVLREVEA